jgi:hypothetical protein
MGQQTISNEFLEESKKHLIQSRDKILHCLAQLRDEDLWWTPSDDTNCIGIILQHLFGNLRQWIISGIGGEQDLRERPKEFRIDERFSRQEMRNMLDALTKELLDTLSHCPPERLLERKTIQGFDNSLLGIVYVAVTHFELHTGQIMYLTKLRLGPNYTSFWEPSNKEQGAE